MNAAGLRSRTVTIKDTPRHLRACDLAEIFWHFGPVVRVSFLQREPLSLRQGFITFANELDCEDAVETMRRVKVDGAYLPIEYGIEKQGTWGAEFAVVQEMRSERAHAHRRDEQELRRNRSPTRSPPRPVQDLISAPRSERLDKSRDEREYSDSLISRTSRREPPGPPRMRDVDERPRRAYEDRERAYEDRERARGDHPRRPDDRGWGYDDHPPRPPPRRYEDDRDRRGDERSYLSSSMRSNDDKGRPSRPPPPHSQARRDPYDAYDPYDDGPEARDRVRRRGSYEGARRPPPGPPQPEELADRLDYGGASPPLKAWASNAGDKPSAPPPPSYRSGPPPPLSNQWRRI